MTVKNTSDPLFGVAYWKKRWVYIPFFHIPSAAITEDGKLSRFSCSPVDSKARDTLQPRKIKSPSRPPFQIEETIVPSLWNEGDLRKMCKRNGLPIIWVIGQPQLSKSKGSCAVRRLKERKIPSITSKEFTAIRKVLHQTNPQIEIIVGIIWHLNKSLGGIGGFVSLEQVLRLNIEDIDAEEEPLRIRLFKRGNRGTQMIFHCLPPLLGKSLCRQINDKSPFVFSNRYGDPLLSTQVSDIIKTAGREAGIEDI